MSYRLKDRVVVVTGASSGIGAEIARAYAEAGCAVALLARRKERCEALAAELNGKGARTLAIACDVRQDAQVEAAFQQVEQALGGIDILVNNAGLGLYGKIIDVTPAILEENFSTNVFGVLRCIRAVVPAMRRRGGGQIVNISSVLGHRALPFMGGYCASKFALNGLTEALRTELAPEKIDVILVAPGITESEFRSSSMTAGEWREDRSIGKTMTPREVALETVAASRMRKRGIVLTRMGRLLVCINRIAPTMADRIATQMLPRP